MGRRGEHSHDELRAIALAAVAELVARHGLAAFGAVGIGLAAAPADALPGSFPGGCMLGESRP